MARNRVIGRDGGLPWRLPGDLAHFKSLTLGKPVVMGRRTFESIGRALPGRANIVISRDAAFTADDATVCRTVDDALAAATAVARTDGADEIMVIGGARIYAAVLPWADRIYLTEIAADSEGDVRFPELRPRDWRETARETARAGPGDEAEYRFVILERRGGLTGK